MKPIRNAPIFALADSGEKHCVLVLTSTFPRWQGDTEPPFVLELCKNLSSHYRLLVLAPHAAGTKVTEFIAGVQVQRFRYAPERWETLCYQGGIIANLKVNGWRHLLLPLFFVAQLWAVLRILRHERIKLIHAHWLIPQGLTAAIAGVFAQNTPPVVCTSHGGDLLSLNAWPLNKVKQWVLKKSAYLTVVNTNMTERALSLGARPSCLQTVSMGVDSHGEFEPLAEVLRVDHEILFVGRLVDKKGLAYLIDALPDILHHCPDVKLTVVGDGPNAVSLKNQVQVLGVSHAVRFLGAMANSSIVDHYRRATVLVAPSVITDQGDQEGLPVVLLEAMACECPVVTTDLPAMQSLLVDQQTAWIVPQRNTGQIASAVVAMLKSPNVRQEMANKAREHVLKNYDWSNVAAQYADIFRSLIR